MYKEFGWKDKGVGSTKYIYGKLKNELMRIHAKNILDMGCGNGEIANKLIKDGFCVYGVDASKEGIAIANKYNNNHFFYMNFDDGIFPDELHNISFDTVISTEVIEHLYDPAAYIDLCKQVLAYSAIGGGGIVLTTPYHGWLKNVVISVSGKFDRHVDPMHRGGHIKFWSKRTINRLMENNNFKVEKFVGCGRIPWLWMSMLVVGKLSK